MRNGTHTSTAEFGNSKLGGITPIIVKISFESVSVRPIALGSACSLRFQNLSLTTAIESAAQARRYAEQGKQAGGRAHYPDLVGFPHGGKGDQIPPYATTLSKRSLRPRQRR